MKFTRMRNFHLLIFFITLFVMPLSGFGQGGVAVNTSGAEADSSAILDVSSTTQGLLVPRMTDAQVKYQESC